MNDHTPAKCHCGSISWERNIKENRYTCCSCKRPLWQPIETAPKDGREFLAYMGTDNIEIARYDLERNEWWIDAYAPPHIEKRWMDAWMPLPEPPHE
jgi:hypothetical protein